ncbi:cysteine hydrolase [Acuticoccus sp. MNP-M23]|uniref:cysteine hydrolase family protein n=1 Tax=Acuticoccus sp. MNP-M23 TaxID=3072793 RepID=UPI002815990C|nr:cysteine hydrolase [Acuticoccus sp. MNP-M23]WMS44550.1 cysteine hydrolase [Acuticoccus sp. MNP-M23]
MDAWRDDRHGGGQLGVGRNYHWQANADVVDMAMPAPPPRPVRISAEPQDVVVDLNRTAIVVIDMQNDFCAPGGWVDHHLGVDVSPGRAPIEPLLAMLPNLRAAGVPVIWVNWGVRADMANLPPNQIHLYKNDGGEGGIAEPLPGKPGGEKVLAQGTWNADVVDELAPEAGDLRVDKHRISGFWDTPLDSILRNLGVKTVLFAGVNTDQCVLHTLTDANFLGYGCVMVSDCCGTTSPDFCAEATVWNVKKCFGFVCDSKDVNDAIATGSGS